MTYTDPFAPNKMLAEVQQAKPVDSPELPPEVLPVASPEVATAPQPSTPSQPAESTPTNQSVLGVQSIATTPGFVASEQPGIDQAALKTNQQKLSEGIEHIQRADPLRVAKAMTDLEATVGRHD